MLFERDKHAVAVDVSSGFSPSYEQLAVTNGYVPIDVAATDNVDLFKQQLVGLGMADVATAGKIVEEGSQLLRSTNWPHWARSILRDQRIS